jgi:hypothetical protein
VPVTIWGLLLLEATQATYMDPARMPSEFGEEDRLQSYIRPVDGVSSPGLYGIRRRGPI